MFPYLKLVLQGGGCALAAVLVHHHHHVSQRVHLDLLGLQVALQSLTPEHKRKGHGQARTTGQRVLQRDTAKVSTVVTALMSSTSSEARTCKSPNDRQRADLLCAARSEPRIPACLLPSARSPFYGSAPLSPSANRRAAGAADAGGP